MTYHLTASGPFIERTTAGTKIRQSFSHRGVAVDYARSILDDLAAEPTLDGEPASDRAIRQYEHARDRLDNYEAGSTPWTSIEIADEIEITLRYTARPDARPEDPIVFPGDSEGTGEDALHTLRVWNGREPGGVDNPSNWTIYELTTAQVRQLAEQLARAVALHTPRRIPAYQLRVGDRLADGRFVTSIGRAATHLRVRFDDMTLDTLPASTDVEIYS